MSACAQSPADRSTIRAMGVPDWSALRERMVNDQLRPRGITDERVIQAMRDVPRHAFVPRDIRSRAYEDRALPTGSCQTISQPFIVGLMLQALELTGEERVLEIGTGTGYQAALLGCLAKEVYTVELLPELAAQAAANIAALQRSNVHVHIADGSLGLPSKAPFDGIIVAAAAPDIPSTLIDQLGPEGTLLIPIGSPKEQLLTMIQKRGPQTLRQTLTPCSFVPLRGMYGWPQA